MKRKRTDTSVLDASSKKPKQYHQPSVDASCFYVYSDEYMKNGALLPSGTIHKFDHCVDVEEQQENSRSFMVHSLIQSYGIHKLANVKLVAPEEATMDQLRTFHSKAYLDALCKISEWCTNRAGEGLLVSTSRTDDGKENTQSSNDDEQETDYQMKAKDEIEQLQQEYGLVDDTEPFPNMMQYCKAIAGGSLTGARLLNSCESFAGEPVIAFAWEGGRHHCFRSKASGFCYINDVVISTLELLKNHKRVLCIDTDVHHHDGVQSAFYHTDKVLTLSFHEYGQGLYPGTGTVNEYGLTQSKGLYHCINVPFAEGIEDSQYFQLFRGVVRKTIDSYRPDCIVWTCGADLLARDKLGHANLSLQLVENLAKMLKAFLIDKTRYPNLNKMLVLGGGGYDNCSTSICWASVMAALCGVQLPDDIPEHKYYANYQSTHFERKIEAPKLISNHNTPDTLRKMYAQVLQLLDKIEPNHQVS